jgi:hypothetical protein
MKKFFIILLLWAATANSQFIEKISPIEPKSTLLSVQLVTFDVLFVVGDITSTYAGLKQNKYEVNPVAGFLVEHPVLLWSVKLVGAAFINWCIRSMYNESALFTQIWIGTLNVGYGIIIYYNFN